MTGSFQTKQVLERIKDKIEKTGRKYFIAKEDLMNIIGEELSRLDQEDVSRDLRERCRAFYGWNR